MTTSRHDRPASSNLIDLPNLIQNITSQRRDGIMTVRLGKEERFMRFNAGNLVGLTGVPGSTFAKSLVWSEVMTSDQLSACLATLGKNFRPEHLAQTVLSRNLATKDGVLDALDCYVEEGFSEIISWTTVKVNFSSELPSDPWGELQTSLGMSINTGSLLLEALRRQDELKAIAQFVPDQWDVLVLDTTREVPSDLTTDAVRILHGWREGMIALSLFERSLLAPFRATTALAHLRRIGLVRPATGSELVVHADSAHSHGRYREAYGLYKRALALGVDSARIHLHMGELAERFNENDTAADSYLIAGMQLTDTSSAVVALRNALRLGANREAPLTHLLAIYTQLEEKDDAVSILMELATLYEERGDLDQAAKAVRQGQELGADPVSTSMALARLAAAEGDQEQAALQLELAAHAAQYGRRNEDAISAWRQLLAIVPDRCEYARECAELLSEIGRTSEAIDILRTNLKHQDEASSTAHEDALVAVYEMLARLAPGDTVAHNWLAKSYERRRDREGATQQLRHIATAQEKAGNDGALAATLERIVELGGNQIDVLTQLAKVRGRLGQDTSAGAAWVAAADAAIILGALKDARALIESGLEAAPTYLSLRVRQAQVASREGDLPAAISALRIGSQLALGSNQLDVARTLLVQLRRQRPDDLVVRIQLAEVAEQLKDPDTDRFLRDVVRSAVRSNDQGLALQFARRRVAIASLPGFEARSELVELLRRSGDTVGALTNGRELVEQLLEHAEFEKAIELLQRLVASNPRNAELVLQLADLYSAVEDARQAGRYYRHAVSLLQVEQRIPDALKALEQISSLGLDDPTIPLAKAALDKGQVVDWEAFRASLSQDQRRRLADEIGTSRMDRRAVGSTSQSLPTIG
jgi:tetratricopeptide (TPR) repeat protein